LKQAPCQWRLANIEGSIMNRMAIAEINLEQNSRQLELPPTAVESEITLYEASRGASRVLTVKDPALCPQCVNIKPGSHRQCAECGGLGYVHIYRQVEIELPAGLFAGKEVCYPGLGRYNLCAEKHSDLIVKIKICKHPYLELIDKNITCTLVVSFAEAILGKTISVPTAAGKTTVKLHPLTTSGKIYRLKGKGLAGGDQLISIEVSPWQKLSKAKLGGQFCPIN